MTAKEAVKKIIENKQWSQSKLAVEAGFKSQSNVTGILNRGSSLRVDNLIQMIDAMGYELVIREKNGEMEFIISE